MSSTGEAWRSFLGVMVVEVHGPAFVEAGTFDLILSFPPFSPFVIKTIEVAMKDAVLQFTEIPSHPHPSTRCKKMKTELMPQIFERSVAGMDRFIDLEILV